MKQKLFDSSLMFYNFAFGSVTIRRNVRPEIRAESGNPHGSSKLRFREFAADRLTGSNRVEKMFDRALKELSNDVHVDEICIQIRQVIFIYSMHLFISTDSRMNETIG
jgi:hypothetical protein